MLEYTITMRGDDDAEAAIRKALKALGCDNIEIMSYIPFEDYLKTLGTSPVKGLAREMSSWFHEWGNGSGDYPTESCARDACSSDIPRKLAEDVYDAIVGRSYPPYEAVELVSDAMFDCLTDCESNGA